MTKKVTTKKKVAKKTTSKKVATTLDVEYKGYRAGTIKGAACKYFDQNKKKLDRQSFIEACTKTFKLTAGTASNWWNEFQTRKAA